MLERLTKGFLVSLTTMLFVIALPFLLGLLLIPSLPPDDRLTAAASLVKDTIATARVPICCEQSVPLTTLSRELGLPLSSQGNPSNAVPFVNERRPFRGNIAAPSLPVRGVYNLMHRIGFRRGLPLAFTLIHVALVWFSLAHQPHAASVVSRASGYRSVAYQEGIVGVPMDQLREQPPLQAAQKIALILELPAMFVASLICAVLVPRSETAWMYTSVPFVPLLWYPIGRWLDGIFGYIPRLCLPRILRGLLAVPAVGVLLVSIGGLTPLYHHRTADSYWVFSGLVLWSGLCITMMNSTFPRLGD
jgi:hypothetical protein